MDKRGTRFNGSSFYAVKPKILEPQISVRSTHKAKLQRFPPAPCRGNDGGATNFASTAPTETHCQPGKHSSNVSAALPVTDHEIYLRPKSLDKEVQKICMYWLIILVNSHQPVMNQILVRIMDIRLFQLTHHLLYSMKMQRVSMTYTFYNFLPKSLFSFVTDHCTMWTFNLILSYLILRENKKGWLVLRWFDCLTVKTASFISYFEVLAA